MNKGELSVTYSISMSRYLKAGQLIQLKKTIDELADENLDMNRILTLLIKALILDDFRK